MPFIINHIDTLMTITSATVKALKFAAKTMHYAALAVGAVLILTGYWLAATHNHLTGMTQTMTDTIEAVHGPVVAEYGESAMLTAEAYMSGVLATYALPACDWALEDLAVAIALDKPSRKRRAKNAPLVAA